jgi:hypothetical protein
MDEHATDQADGDEEERLSMPGHESELVDRLEEEVAAESSHDESVPTEERDAAAGGTGVVDSVPGSGEPPD